MKASRVCLLSPWHGGSHRRWADGLRQFSTHEIDIYSLPDRHWKWRMHGAAATLAEKVIQSGKNYDLFLADDMMDVAVFSALVKGKGLNAPIYTYFHENQICYPVSPRDTDIEQARDLHYGYVNFTTALASDKLLFNSKYHMDAFLESLPGFLSRFPDYNQKGFVEGIVKKSSVLPLGMDLKELDKAKPDEIPENDRPLILWNHRWEYDKCPDEFLRLMLDLHERDMEFDVVLLGERGNFNSPELKLVKELLGDRILHDGALDDFTDYAAWLWRADIAPVTSIHDFFGGSVVEALYCGCHVLLPNRLAYPEHVSGTNCLYEEYPELRQKVVRLIQSDEWKLEFSEKTQVHQYDWEQVIDQYNGLLSLT